jgi:DNA-binding response OmpR family regulator
MFRLLIVEQNSNHADIIAEIALSLNHHPVKANTKKAASALLSSDRFDYFVINMLIPLSDGGDANFYNCLGLIEQIRDHYPKSVEYPVIIFNDSLIDSALLIECMEDGTSSFLAFDPELPDDQATLRKAMQRLTDKARSKRGSYIPPPDSAPDIGLVHKKLAARYKLVVDLKTMKVFFNGVELPSGKGGLQPRHKVFLFVLAKNIGNALSAEAIQDEVKKYRLDCFADTSKNIRNKIKSTLRAAAVKHPAKITDNAANTLLKTERVDLTRLDLDKDDVFTIYGEEEYPTL